MMARLVADAPTLKAAVDTPLARYLKRSTLSQKVFFYIDPAHRQGAECRHDALVRLGLAGNLAGFELIRADGKTVPGRLIPYNSAPAGYTDDPQENIVYVSAHDNQTLYDINQYKIPAGRSMAERVRIQNLGLSLVALAQVRQLAFRAVDRVLDRVRVDVALLQPGRRELGQLGEHQLGLVAGDADREPDHPSSTATHSSRPRT